jgi:entericidin B
MLPPLTERIIMKKTISILLLLAFSAGLTACNTFRGAGQDIERGGEKVQDAATKAQNKN